MKMPWKWSVSDVFWRLLVAWTTMRSPTLAVMAGMGHWPLMPMDGAGLQVIRVASNPSDREVVLVDRGTGGRDQGRECGDGEQLARHSGGRLPEGGMRKRNSQSAPGHTSLRSRDFGAGSFLFAGPDGGLSGRFLSAGLPF